MNYLCVVFVCEDAGLSPSMSSLRSLEEPLAERRYASQGQGDLQNVLCQLDFTHTSEELLQAEVTRLEGR